jgi:hypothetical protein
MTILIAIVGLLATIYAVLPRERRLELRLRLTALDAIIAVVTFLLILYCEYYPFVLSHPIWGVPLAWPTKRWPKDLTPAGATDLILLLAVAATAARMRFRRLSRGNIGTFRKLLDELYWAGGYEEIFNFLERHGKPLFKLAISDFVVARLRGWLRPSLSFRTLAIDLEMDQFIEGSSAVPNGSRSLRAAWLRAGAKSATRGFKVILDGSEPFCPIIRRAKRKQKLSSVAFFYQSRSFRKWSACVHIWGFQ